MKKYFVFSDVHGHYDELMRDLRLAGFDEKNEEHIIVSCGDNFDRGPKSFEMFVFLNEFPEHRKYLIKGNHEFLLEDLAERNQVTQADIVNGTADTWKEFQIKLNDPDVKRVIGFTRNMLHFLELPGHLFVHGFIPHTDYHNATPNNWKKATWIDSSLLLKDLPNLNTVIVVGHKATSNFHPYNDMFIQMKTPKRCGLIAIDGTAVINKKINIFVLNEDGSYDNKKYMCMLKPVDLKNLNKLYTIEK